MPQPENRALRILDMAVCTPPQKIRPDAELLATFALVLWPVRAQGLKLVRHNGEVKLWTSTPDLRFVADARQAIIEAATAEARRGLEGLMGA
ncbi:MAG: hypothetical protein ACU0A5_15015 [Salipiger marinus]|uniref:hypothetical protein n=1 Tax=Salipiger marinus TaxID=555512 RepID=UPI004058913B